MASSLPSSNAFARLTSDKTSYQQLFILPVLSSQTLGVYIQKHGNVLHDETSGQIHRRRLPDPAPLAICQAPGRAGAHQAGRRKRTAVDEGRSSESSTVQERWFSRPAQPDRHRTAQKAQVVG